MPPLVLTINHMSATKNPYSKPATKQCKFEIQNNEKINNFELYQCEFMQNKFTTFVISQKTTEEANSPYWSSPCTFFGAKERKRTSFFTAFLSF